MASEKTIKEMADMLISGARMLQYHCDTCKSPLFQKNDKILCPVCGELREGDSRKTKMRRGLDKKTSEALRKKKRSLLKRLDNEEKPEEISAILDALTKIEKMLNE